MKTAKKPSNRATISTHEMRFEFGRVLQAVKAGRSLTLTYRNKPLARIVPLKTERKYPDDPSSGFTNWPSRSGRSPTPK